MQILNKKTDSIPFGSVYIGRGSPLGNPFTHLSSKFDNIQKVETREEAIYQFKKWLNQKVSERNPEVCDELNKLIIKNLKKEDLSLVCFCKPKPCHGDVIKEFVELQKYCLNWFSNMIPFEKPLIHQNINYYSVENFYQAMKTERSDTFTRGQIALMSPFVSKKEGRKIKIRSDWEDIKLKVMEYALKHKFSQEPWKSYLKNYKGDLVEWNNWHDTFWGVDIFSGTGQNLLGFLLTEIKNSL